MTGYIYRGHALIEIAFVRQSGSDVPVEFVIDTGFTGYMTLPLRDVAVLGLPFDREIDADLADGSSIKALIYIATILWHGQPRRVEVIATGERPLLGLALLKDNNVNIDFTENGSVTIAPRTQTAAF